MHVNADESSAFCWQKLFCNPPQVLLDDLEVLNAVEADDDEGYVVIDKIDEHGDYVIGRDEFGDYVEREVIWGAVQIVPRFVSPEDQALVRETARLYPVRGTTVEVSDDWSDVPQEVIDQVRATGSPRMFRMNQAPDRVVLETSDDGENWVTVGVEPLVVVDEVR